MYISFRSQNCICLKKICLVSDEACDIVLSMHFYVHKKKIFDNFCHFFYAVDESLAILSHRSFEIGEGAIYSILISVSQFILVCWLLVH